MRLGVRVGALAATFALGSTASCIGIATAHGEPTGCPPASLVDGGACSGRLISLNAKDFTITGTLVEGRSPIVLSGGPEAYLPSTGYAGAPPEAVQQWDATISRVADLDPADPNWYGNGKARAFLPAQLNQLATRFPPGTVAVRFVPDDSIPGQFRLSLIQPTG